MPQKKPRNLRMAPSDSIVKRRRTNAAPEVDVFYERDKKLDHLKITIHCHNVQWRIAIHPGILRPAYLATLEHCQLPESGKRSLQSS